MKRLLCALCVFLASVTSIYSQISFSGNSDSVITVTPETSTGLDAIYVVSGVSGLSVSYQSSAGRTDVVWYSYGSQGGGYAEEIAGIERDGSTTTLAGVTGNCGYIVQDGTSSTYFWIVDYSAYRLELRGASFPSSQDCGRTTISVDADCDPIRYYSITGAVKTLEREITITYNTLSWDEDNRYFSGVETTVTVDSVDESTVITAPLCDTTFTIEGDQFLKEWGEAETLTTDTFQTTSIEVYTYATQEERDNSNEQSEEVSAYGGSGPVTIEFNSYCSDAVTYKEWQISTDSEFSTLEYRYFDADLTFTFREEGTRYVKFVASNSDATCSTEGEVYEVTIGESVLECPNVFSPNASAGVNDEWKVSYKSITSFRCWIFDRYGNQIISFSDPSQGWDGKYKGKFVKSGVYFYVIEATGADGKEYKLSGDINILKSNAE